MPYGYIGTKADQTAKNYGVYSLQDIIDLKNQKKLGGSLELIAEESYSSATANVDFLSIKEDQYDIHLLQLSNIGLTTGNYNQPAIRLYESGVLETASVYRYGRQDNFYDGTQQESRTTSINSFRIMVDLGTATTRIRNAYCLLYNLGDSTKYSTINFQGFAIRGNDQSRMSFGGGCLPQTSVVDGIRIFGSAGGNFSSYEIKLYGYKK